MYPAKRFLEVEEGGLMDWARRGFPWGRLGSEMCTAPKKFADVALEAFQIPKVNFEEGRSCADGSEMAVVYQGRWVIDAESMAL